MFRGFPECSGIFRVPGFIDARLFHLVQFVKCWQLFLELNAKTLYRRSGRDVTKTGNGERGAGSGERGTGNGERK